MKEVNFSCSSEIPHHDQEDITDGSSVQSSVTIDISNTTNLSMVCVCSAIWEPSEDLYRKISSVTVFVNNDVQGDDQCQKIRFCNTIFRCCLACLTTLVQMFIHHHLMSFTFYSAGQGSQWGFRLCSLLIHVK